MGEVLKLGGDLVVGEVSLRKWRCHCLKLRGSEAMGGTRASIPGGVASRVAASLPMRLVPRVCSSLFESGNMQRHALELNAVRECNNPLEEVRKLDGGAVMIVLSKAVESLRVMAGTVVATEQRAEGMWASRGQSTLMAFLKGMSTSSLQPWRVNELGARWLPPTELKDNGKEEKSMDSSKVVEAMSLKVGEGGSKESLDVQERGRQEKWQEKQNHNQS